MVVDSVQKMDLTMENKTIALEDLTDFHRARVFERARTWRFNNHPKILATMKGNVEVHPPQGSAIFSPDKWTAPNWLWFSTNVIAVKLMGRKSIF